MSKDVYIIERRNTRFDVIPYSVEAESEDEAKAILEAMKNKDETFARVREVISRHSYAQNKIS